MSVCVNQDLEEDTKAVMESALREFKPFVFSIITNTPRNVNIESIIQFINHNPSCFPEQLCIIDAHAALKQSLEKSVLLRHQEEELKMSKKIHSAHARTGSSRSSRKINDQNVLRFTDNSANNIQVETKRICDETCDTDREVSQIATAIREEYEQIALKQKITRENKKALREKKLTELISEYEEDGLSYLAARESALQDLSSNSDSDINSTNDWDDDDSDDEQNSVSAKLNLLKASFFNEQETKENNNVSRYSNVDTENKEQVSSIKEAEDKLYYAKEDVSKEIGRQRLETEQRSTYKSVYLCITNYPNSIKEIDDLAKLGIEILCIINVESQIPLRTSLAATEQEKMKMIDGNTKKYDEKMKMKGKEEHGNVSVNNSDNVTITHNRSKNNKIKNDSNKGNSNNSKNKRNNNNNNKSNNNNNNNEYCNSLLGELVQCVNTGIESNSYSHSERIQVYKYAFPVIETDKSNVNNTNANNNEIEKKFRLSISEKSAMKEIAKLIRKAFNEWARFSKWNEKRKVITIPLYFPLHYTMESHPSTPREITSAKQNDNKSRKRLNDKTKSNESNNNQAKFTESHRENKRYVSSADSTREEITSERASANSRKGELPLNESKQSFNVNNKMFSPESIDEIEFKRSAYNNYVYNIPYVTSVTETVGCVVSGCIKQTLESANVKNTCDHDCSSTKEDKELETNVQDDYNCNQCKELKCSNEKVLTTVEQSETTHDFVNTYVSEASEFYEKKVDDLYEKIKLYCTRMDKDSLNEINDSKNKMHTRKTFTQMLPNTEKMEHKNQEEIYYNIDRNLEEKEEMQVDSLLLSKDDKKVVKSIIVESDNINNTQETFQEEKKVDLSDHNKERERNVEKSARELEISLLTFATPSDLPQFASLLNYCKSEAEKLAYNTNESESSSSDDDDDDDDDDHSDEDEEEEEEEERISIQEEDKEEYNKQIQRKTHSDKSNTANKKEMEQRKQQQLNELIANTTPTIDYSFFVMRLWRWRLLLKYIYKYIFLYHPREEVIGERSALLERCYAGLREVERIPINLVLDAEIVITREIANTRYVNCKLYLPIGHHNEKVHWNGNIHCIDTVVDANSCKETKTIFNNLSKQNEKMMSFAFVTSDNERSTHVDRYMEQCDSCNNTPFTNKNLNNITEVNIYKTETEKAQEMSLSKVNVIESFLHSHVRNDISLPNVFHLMSEVIVDNSSELIARAYEEAVSNAKKQARAEYEATLNVRHKNSARSHNRSNVSGSDTSRVATPPSQMSKEPSKAELRKSQRVPVAINNTDTSSLLSELEQQYIQAIPFKPLPLTPPSTSQLSSLSEQKEEESLSSKSNATINTTNHPIVKPFMSFVIHLEQEACTALLSTAENNSSIIELNSNIVNGQAMELSVFVWSGSFVETSSTLLSSLSSLEPSQTINSGRQGNLPGLCTLKLSSINKLHLHSNGMLELFSPQSAGYRVLLASDGSYVTSQCNKHLFVSGKDGTCTLHVNSTPKFVYQLHTSRTRRLQKNGRLATVTVSEIEREDGVRFVVNDDTKQIVSFYFSESVVLRFKETLENTLQTLSSSSLSSSLPLSRDDEELKEANCESLTCSYWSVKNFPTLYTCSQGTKMKCTSKQKMAMLGIICGIKEKIKFNFDLNQKILTVTSSDIILPGIHIDWKHFQMHVNTPYQQKENIYDNELLPRSLFVFDCAFGGLISFTENCKGCNQVSLEHEQECSLQNHKMEPRSEMETLSQVNRVTPLGRYVCTELNDKISDLPLTCYTVKKKQQFVHQKKVNKDVVPKHLCLCEIVNSAYMRAFMHTNLYPHINVLHTQPAEQIFKQIQQNCHHCSYSPESYNCEKLLTTVAHTPLQNFTQCGNDMNKETHVESEQVAAVSNTNAVATQEKIRTTLINNENKMLTRSCTSEAKLKCERRVKGRLEYWKMVSIPNISSKSSISKQSQLCFPRHKENLETDCKLTMHICDTNNESTTHSIDQLDSTTIEDNVKPVTIKEKKDASDNKTQLPLMHSTYLVKTNNKQHYNEGCNSVTDHGHNVIYTDNLKTEAEAVGNQVAMRRELFRIKPSVIYFGKVAINHCYVTELEIYNCGDRPSKFYINVPKKCQSELKVIYKRELLAAGMKRNVYIELYARDKHNNFNSRIACTFDHTKPESVKASNEEWEEQAILNGK